MAMQFLLYALNLYKLSKVEDLLYVFRKLPLFVGEVQVVIGQHPTEMFSNLNPSSMLELN